MYTQKKENLANGFDFRKESKLHPSEKSREIFFEMYFKLKLNAPVLEICKNLGVVV